MYDVMLSQLNYLASSILNGQETALRQASSAHPYFVPAQVFRTKDSWLVLFITHDSFWRLFCEAVGHPEWVGSPEHGTISARSRNRARVIADVSAALAQRTTEEWLERLLPLGIVVAGIKTLDQALHSEQTRARGMIVEVPAGDATLQLVGNPIKVLGVDEQFAEPPRSEEHTSELQSLMRISYAVFCLKKKKKNKT